MIKRILSILTCLVIAFTCLTATATPKKAAKPTQKKIVKKTTVKKTTKSVTKKNSIKPAPIIKKVGNLSGIITYQDSDAGTRPDSGAILLLVKKTAKITKATDTWFCFTEPNKLFKIDAYVSSVNMSNGSFNFKNISVGDYVMIAISAKTINKLQSDLPEECPSQLNGLLDYNALISSYKGKYKNIKVFDITVKENQTTSIKYDFSLGK